MLNEAGTITVKIARFEGSTTTSTIDLLALCAEIITIEGRSAASHGIYK